MFYDTFGDVRCPFCHIPFDEKNKIRDIVENKTIVNGNGYSIIQRMVVTDKLRCACGAEFTLSASFEEEIEK